MKNEARVIKSLLVLLLCLFLSGLCLAQDFPDLSGDYFGQAPPDSIPQIFAHGLISVDGHYEYGLALSPDGREIFYTSEGPGPGLMVTRQVDGKWSEPVAAKLCGNDSWEFEAFYTMDGQKLYFSCIVEGERMPNIWCAEKSAEGYDAPYKLESAVNESDVMWATFASDGTMYYTNISARKMYMSALVEGGYPGVEPIDIEFGSHPFVAPDGGFLLFNGKGDIWVSFRQDTAGWAEPVSLGGLINSEHTETCPSLSPDGKYLFFSRYDEPGEKSNIYWVSSRIIERLRPGD